MSDQETTTSFRDHFPLNLQRLVDGELSVSAKHDFLHSIDLHANDRWREVALTLLEQRLWHRQLNSPAIQQAVLPVAAPRPAMPAGRSSRRSVATRTGSILAACCLGLIVGLLIPINNGSQPFQHTTLRAPSIDPGIDSMQASNGQPNKPAEQILIDDSNHIAIEILENLARQGYRIDTQNFQLTDQYNNTQNVDPELTSFVAYPSGL